MLITAKHKAFIRFLSLIFSICVAGCKATNQNGTPSDAHSIVKRSLPEVTQAILRSFPQGYEVKWSKLHLVPSDLPENSYRCQIHQKGNWFVHPKNITISATAVNSDETGITVRVVRFIPINWDCLHLQPKPPDIRYPEIEKQTLDTILKSLN